MVSDKTKECAFGGSGEVQECLGERKGKEDMKGLFN